MIEVSGKGFEKAEQLLSGIKDGVPKAITRAINKSTTKARTTMGKTVVKRYRFKSGMVKDSIIIRRASYSNMTATVRSVGFRNPLIRFKVNPNNPKYMGKGNYHRASVLKSTASKAIRGFTARMPTGHIGVFERTGEITSGKKEEIRELYGPSVPEMLGGDKIKFVEEKSAEYLDEILESEIDKLLRGGR